MAVFYQKYRPQTFAEVVGQDPIVRTLRNAAAAGDLAHAYLLTGSRGVGKTTIARLIAKAANCLTMKDGNPCGVCSICTSIANGSSLDVIEIDAASHTGVDNVRELIDHAQFRPSSMKTKVFIIDEVHMLSKAAFNALLKTLEEPPAHALFILATTDIEKVPDTIMSRTQRFDFKRILPADMTAALHAIIQDQKLTLPEGVVEAVVSQADGSMRDALSKLNIIAAAETTTLEDAQRLLGITSIETVQNLVTKIAEHDAASLPAFFEAALAGGTDPVVFNRSVLQYLRELLSAQLTGNRVNQNEQFAAHLSQISTPKLLYIIRLFLRSYKEISYAPSPDLPVLLAAIEASLHGVNLAPAAAQVPAHTVAPVSPSTVSVVVDQDITKTDTGTVLDTHVSTTIMDESFEADTSVTLEEINAWWPDVIAKVRVENSPIATLLKNSPITEVIDGKIIVGVKYLFHKEHLDNKKHNSLITQTITAVSGKRLGLKSVIKKEMRSDSDVVHTMDSINDALKVFGGELI